MSAAFWPVVVVGALFVWIVCVAVDLGLPILCAKWIVSIASSLKALASLKRWYKEPGNSVRAMTWVGSLFIVLITLNSPVDSLLGSLRTDAITVAVTVIVLEELGRYRADLQEKERIICQMGSRSNDFALEAARLAKKHGWLEDGSLEEAHLVDANLAGVSLVDARLTRSTLHGASLELAHLAGASLQNAGLAVANLVGAHMLLTNLKGCDLWKTNLEYAYMLGANLEQANLKQANLQNAYMVNANLEGANLQSANLEGAMLTDANLKEANLVRTNLKDAYLWGANLLETTLIDTNCKGTKYNSKTQWPDGFDPQAAGAVLYKWDKDKGWILASDVVDKQEPFDGSPRLGYSTLPVE